MAELPQAGVGAATAKADGASAVAAKTIANSASAVAVSNGGSALSAADNMLSSASMMCDVMCIRVSSFGLANCSRYILHSSRFPRPLTL